LNITEDTGLVFLRVWPSKGTHAKPEYLDYSRIPQNLH